MQRDLNVTKGDSVTIAILIYRYFFILKMTMTLIGATSVFLNTWWPTVELKYALSVSGGKIVYADGPRVARLKPLQSSLGLDIIGDHDPTSDFVHGYFPIINWPLVTDWQKVAIDADDDLVFIYSSGKSCHPKGFVQTHQGAISAIYAWLMQRPLTERLSPTKK